jgi:hypothetical protein
VRVGGDWRWASTVLGSGQLVGRVRLEVWTATDKEGFLFTLFHKHIKVNKALKNS